MSAGARPGADMVARQPATWGGIRRALRRCLELARAGALPPSLLLVGPPGLGREALAVELAAALTCRTAPTDPCSCASCERVRRGLHPDVHHLQPRVAAERRGVEGGGEPEAGREGRRAIRVDEVRELVATLDRLPYEGSRRVVVLDPVHTPPLGADAAAVLLKPLEEPPPRVIFLALAANPAQVLPTIASRTVQLRVPAPSAAEAVAYLAARLDLSREGAAAALGAAGGDAAAALALGGADPRALAGLVAAAVEGDPLALAAVARHLREEGTAVPLVTAILATLRSRAAAQAESLLEAAAALLHAQRQADTLNLHLEVVASGLLAAVP